MGFIEGSVLKMTQDRFFGSYLVFFGIFDFVLDLGQG